MLTPHMRQQFYDNARNLRRKELLKLVEMVEELCPAAVHNMPNADGNAVSRPPAPSVSPPSFACRMW